MKALFGTHPAHILSTEQSVMFCEEPVVGLKMTVLNGYIISIHIFEFLTASMEAWSSSCSLLQHESLVTIPFFLTGDCISLTFKQIDWPPVLALRHFQGKLWLCRLSSFFCCCYTGSNDIFYTLHLKRKQEFCAWLLILFCFCLSYSTAALYQLNITPVSAPKIQESSVNLVCEEPT